MVKLQDTNLSVEKIRNELREKIKDFDRYNLKIELDNAIVTIECVGVGLAGYEIDVDAGGKTFDRVINELVPKMINLIETCKKKS